jgi:hypothetical protein
MLVDGQLIQWPWGKKTDSVDCLQEERTRTEFGEQRTQNFAASAYMGESPRARALGDG